EGRTRVVNLRLLPKKPSINVYIHQHIFLPGESPQITVQGFVPAKTMDVSVYRVDSNVLLVKHSGALQDLLEVTWTEDTRKFRNLDEIPSLVKVKSLSVPITQKDFEGAFTQRVDIPALDKGIYVVGVNAGETKAVDWLMVTSIGMVAKNVGPQTLAFAVDLKTGDPIRNCEISAYAGGSLRGTSRTDAKGLADLHVSGDFTGRDQPVIVARDGNSIAFMSQYISSRQESNKLIYTYTERPVYKPGQTVYFKGIVRQNESGKYTVPASLPITIEVRDPMGTLVYRASSRTDKFGSYAGSFDLNPESPTGEYAISTSINGEGRGSDAWFRVAAYRKPEYSVKVKFDKPKYIRGDKARVSVSANYYFGAPLANAELNYIVRRTSYWLFEDQEEDQDEYGGGYQDYGGYGEQVAEGQLRTDSNGEATLEFPASWEQRKESNALEQDQQFSIEVSATDKSQQAVTGSASVVVTGGEFALKVTPDRYVVDPGGTVNFIVQARNYDKTPVVEQDITLLIGREKWIEDKSTFEVYKEQKVKTDKAGKAALAFSLGDKPYVEIVAKATDRRGNVVSAKQWIWSGGEYFDDGSSRTADLNIVLDKKTYNAGDTAKVLIRVPQPGSTVLVTVEGDKVYERRVIHVAKKSAVLTFQVRNEYKPNFYIDACLVRDKNFLTQEVRAKVAMGAEALKVDITPNKTRYRPGENAVYKIKVEDSKGKPASAQMSVGVVDEAIYAIQEDTTTPILGYFYARKPNMVNTSFSFPQIYLSDPDKAGTGLLSAEMRKIRVRKRFLDTAYWNPFVVTDSKGEAVVKFKMPDNLTTWRTTVRAITGDTSCGEAKNTVLARQDFMVRLETPRFLIQSDRAKIAAVVNNYTGRAQDVVVDLASKDLSLERSTQRRISVKDGGSERVEWEVGAPKIGDAEMTVRAYAGKYGDAVQLVIPVQPHGVLRESAFVGELTEANSEKVTFDVGSDAVEGMTKMKVKIAPSLAASLISSLHYLATYPWGCTEQTTSSFLPDVILSRSMKELGVRDAKLESQLPDMVKKGLFRLYKFKLMDGGWSWYEYGKSDPWMSAYVCYGLIRAREAGYEVNEEILNQGLSQLQTFVQDRKVEVSTRVYIAYVLSLTGKDVIKDLGDIENRTNLHPDPIPALTAGDDPLRLKSGSKLDSKTLALITLTYANLRKYGDAGIELGRLMGRAVKEQDALYWRSDQWYAEDVETT
ncbi:MAG TPA: MG2 domain-containing protein, partial [Armatimonadota bacterium]